MSHDASDNSRTVHAQQEIISGEELMISRTRVGVFAALTLLTVVVTYSTFVLISRQKEAKKYERGYPQFKIVDQITTSQKLTPSRTF